MKTGTSTLQATLSRNEESLAAANHRYLGWPMRTAANIGRKLDAFDATTNIIISDEGLWHFCGTKRSDTKAIAALLADREVTVVVYLRRPDEYVESWFSQGLKKGSGTPSILAFLSSGGVNSAPYDSGEAGGPASFDLTHFRDQIDLSILKKLAYFTEAFPSADIVVRPYEADQLAGGDIVSDFVEAAGLRGLIPDVELARATNENISPSAEMVLFTSLLRQVAAVPEDVLQFFLTTQSSPRATPVVPSPFREAIETPENDGTPRSELAFFVDLLHRAYGGPEDVLRLFLETQRPPISASGGKSRILRLREAVAINESMRSDFREVQATWGGGATDDFFLNWEIDPATYRETSFRDVYDHHIGSG